MHWLSLPEPGQGLSLACTNELACQAWLAAQPQAQPLHMLAALSVQVEALEGADIAPGTRLNVLDQLRRASLPAQEAVAPRYLRKALPMLAEDEQCFERAQHLWLHFGIAYFRLASQLAANERLLALHRAAGALRLAQLCHIQAARSCPALLNQLLFAILQEADTHQLLQSALTDPDFPHLGEATITGHLAWSFLLQLIAPYRLTAAQLVVANRAVSRWRELASFQRAPSNDPKSHFVDLRPLLAIELPNDVPCWLEIRKVLRKIKQRLEALQAGEGPEALKLGRELSGAACIRLLHEMQASLAAQSHPPATERGEIELAFGAEHAYTVFTGELLVRRGLTSDSASLAHRRVAMFGFDRVSALPTAVKQLSVPSEKWTQDGGKALRPLAAGSSRRQAPCLIASNPAGQPRLGVLLGLQSSTDGVLSAELRWYAAKIEAGRVAQTRQPEPIPAFLLDDGEQRSLLVPSTAGVTLAASVALEGLSLPQVTPIEVLERGVDFVRYAIKP